MDILKFVQVKREQVAHEAQRAAERRRLLKLITQYEIRVAGFHHELAESRRKYAEYAETVNEQILVERYNPSPYNYHDHWLREKERLPGCQIETEDLIFGDLTGNLETLGRLRQQYKDVS